MEVEEVIGRSPEPDHRAPSVLKKDSVNGTTVAERLKRRWMGRQTHISATLDQAGLPALTRPFKLEVLERGSHEALKAGVHATALGLAAVMGLYNAAAWLRRRERHLAVNTILYAALTAWEREQVAHHLAGCWQSRDEFVQEPSLPPGNLPAPPDSEAASPAA